MFVQPVARMFTSSWDCTDAGVSSTTCTLRQEASCCSVLTEFSVLCGGNKKGVFDLDRREVPALNKEKLEYTHTHSKSYKEHTKS